MDAIGLIIEFLLIIGLPIILPMIFIIVIGKINFNKKVKRIIVLILSNIYNFIIGFLGFFIAFFIAFNPFGITNAIIYYSILIITFLIIFVPVNVFAKRKCDIHVAIYIIINILMLILGYVVMINTVRS